MIYVQIRFTPVSTFFLTREHVIIVRTWFIIVQPLVIMVRTHFIIVQGALIIIHTFFTKIYTDYGGKSSQSCPDCRRIRFTPVQPLFTPVRTCFTPVRAPFTPIHTQFTPVRTSFTPVRPFFSTGKLSSNPNSVPHPILFPHQPRFQLKSSSNPN